MSDNYRSIIQNRVMHNGPFGRKTDGDGRITFAIPLGTTPDATSMQQAADAVMDETGFGVTIESRDGAAFVDTEAADVPHVVLDVVESALQNALGDGATQPRSSRKSLIHASGNTDREAQPCFILSRRLSPGQVEEVERLLSFVAGVEANGYHNDTRFYLSPGSQSLGHIPLDVSEIIVRRIAAEANISISEHSIKLLPRQR